MVQYLKCTIDILTDVRSFNRFFPSYAVVTLRKFGLMFELSMDMTMYVQERPAEIQALVLWNLIGHNIPDPSPPPISILPLLSCLALTFPPPQLRRFSKISIFFCHRLQNARI
jgi:hypothetical protein